jgi:hypothetical protein
MSAAKEQLVKHINNCRGAALDERAIARKMFLLDPTFIFRDDSITGFKILNSVSERFRVPLGCVKIAGSSQTGFSSFQNRDFIAGKSDLDIAVVSPNLFQRYCEIVYEVTNGYRNRTGFELGSLEQFQENLQIGYFRPDLMPMCTQKNDWFVFFKTLTDRYSITFKSVNGGIYFSETFFAGKQIAVVRKLTEA